MMFVMALGCSAPIDSWGERTKAMSSLNNAKGKGCVIPL